jgi:hypothetical protein
MLNGCRQRIIIQYGPKHSKCQGSGEDPDADSFEVTKVYYKTRRGANTKPVVSPEQILKGTERQASSGSGQAEVSNRES